MVDDKGHGPDLNVDPFLLGQSCKFISKDLAGCHAGLVDWVKLGGQEV